MGYYDQGFEKGVNEANFYLRNPQEREAIGTIRQLYQIASWGLVPSSDGFHWYKGIKEGIESKLDKIP